MASSTADEIAALEKRWTTGVLHRRRASRASIFDAPPSTSRPASGFPGCLAAASLKPQRRFGSNSGVPLPGGRNVLSQFANLTARRRARSSIRPSEVASGSCLSSWVVDPGTPWVYRWNQLVGLAILYSAVAIPVAIAFEAPVTGSLWWALDLFVVDVIFWLDLVLQFRTGSPRNGR